MNFEQTFEIQIYNLSHRELTLKNTFDIDVHETIIFTSVFYIQLPDTLKMFKIRIGKDLDKKYVENQNKNNFFYWELQRVYVIEDNNNTYYIGAGAMTHRVLRHSEEIVCKTYTNIID